MKTEARENCASSIKSRLSRVLHLLALTLLTGLCLAEPAGAQTYTTPERPVLDSRGVDVNAGVVTTAAESTSIGDMGFAEMWNGQTRFNRFGAYISNAGGNRTVFLHGVSKKFTPSAGGTWQSADQDGSTLVVAGAYSTYTATDGSVYLFGDMVGTGNQSAWPNIAIKSFLITLTRPDGKVYTYHYSQLFQPVCGHTCYDKVYTRVQSITTSDGYMLKAGYASSTVYASFNTLTSVEAIDLSVDYCDPNADTCTGLTQTWPSQTISTSGSTVTLTDQDSNAASVTLSVNKVTAVDRPGSTGGDLVVTHDGSGRVATFTENGETYTYSYVDSGSNRTTTITGPGSTTETYVTDIPSSRPTSYTDELGKVTTWQYDAYGRVTRETQPEGNYTQWTYDARGNVTEVRRVAKPGSGLADIVTTANFDTTCTNPLKCNKPNYTIDERGNRTDFTYSSTHGGLTRIQLPSPGGTQPRPELNYTYTALYAQGKNAFGVLVTSSTPQYKVTQITWCRTAATCAGTANETKITLAYNTPNLLLTSKTVAAGDGSVSATETYTYNSRDDLASVDGPLAGTDDTTYYFFGVLHHLTGTIGPDPDGAGSALRPATRYSNTPRGRLTKLEAGYATGTDAAALAAMTVLQTVDYTIDSNGHRTKETMTAGGSIVAVTQYGYDNSHRLECTAVRMNPAVYASLPSSACTLGTTGSAGPDRIVRRTYDNADHLTTVTAAYGSSDASDEAVATYTNNGELWTVTDAESNKTTYEYDGHDRLVKTFFPSPTTDNTSSTTDYEQVGYDHAGNVTSFRTRRNETLTMTYDNHNRLIVKAVPDRSGLDATHERDVYFGYDLVGNMTYARFDSASGEGVSNGYDALGGLISSTTNLDSVSRTLSYLYDAAGNITRITHPDSNYFEYLHHASGALYYARPNGSGGLFYPTRDTAGRVDLLRRLNTSTAGWDFGTTYSYDAVSRLATLAHNPAGTTHDATTTLTYNPASQIATRALGNDLYAWTGQTAVSRGYTANGLNQYSAVAGTNFTYDANGNLTSDGTYTFTYDIENRLVARSGGGTTAALRYDPLGRLHEVVGSDTGTTRFLYDGSDLVAEYNGSGTLLRRYVHGTGAGDDPLVWFEGSGVADTARRYLYADERGSIVAVTGSTGTVSYVNTYDEYGIPNGSGNDIATRGRFRYTGQAYLPELGMYYYKARMYSPTLGRFMQTDPIGYWDGMNMYAYVKNDPLNLIDPTGLSGEDDDEAEDDPDDVITVWGFRFHVRGSSNFTGGGSGNGPGQGRPDNMAEEIVVNANNWVSDRLSQNQSSTGIYTNAGVEALINEIKVIGYKNRGDSRRNFNISIPLLDKYEAHNVIWGQIVALATKNPVIVVLGQTYTVDITPDYSATSYMSNDGLLTIRIQDRRDRHNWIKVRFWTSRFKFGR